MGAAVEMRWLALAICLIALRAAAFTLPFASQGLGSAPATFAYLSAVSTILPAANGSTALDTTIPNGSSALLTWDADGACTGTGFSTGGAGSGTAAVSPTTTTTYSVNCGGHIATSLVTVSGHLIDAAATYCASNLGGDGSTGTPWNDACIQAAVNAASNGDTIFLAAGNWSLHTGTAATGASWAAGQITFTTSVNLGVVVGELFNTGGFAPTGYNGTWTAAAGTTCGGGGCTVIAAEASTLTTPASVLGTIGLPVTIGKTLNLIGAGSGNTFTPYGAVIYDASTNNPAIHDFCPTSGRSITCVKTVGTDNAAGTGGFVSYTGANCTNVALAHLYIDGSTITAGGSGAGTLNSVACPGPIMFSDIRLLTFNSTAIPSESQFSPNQTNNITVQNSVFAAPVDVSNTTFYSGVELLNWGGGNTGLFQNNLIYMGAFNPIDTDNLVFTGNVYIASHGDGTAAYGSNPGIALAACGQGIVCFPANGGTTGDYHFTLTGNYLYAAGNPLGVGGGVNDPGGGGATSDQNIVGNWMIADKPSISGCHWHIFGHCLAAQSVTSASVSGGVVSFVTSSVAGSKPAISAGSQFLTGAFANTGYNISGDPNTNNTYWLAVSVTPSGSTQTITAACGGSAPQPACPTGTATSGTIAPWDSIDGMQVNGTGGPSGNCTIDLSGTCFNASNNSLIGTTLANFDATGNGMNDSTSPLPYHNNTTVNFNGFKNYLSSPGNQYLSDVNSINPHVTGNFCSGSTFTQTDSTTCATSGFATLPTVSFSLGTLSGNTVQLVNPAYTAQYGAVQWLVSTSPTTPTSSGQTGTGCNGGACSWSFVPPVSLSPVAHGNTVYMWVMDSASGLTGNISSPASAALP